MHFEYDCWFCDETNSIWGEPKGFFTVWYQLPYDWTCWCCGRVNTTPDD